MPLPGSIGTPLFEGANATEFLERFNDLCNDYSIALADRLIKLPKYCAREVGEAIKTFKAYRERDYSALQKAFLSEYREHDTFQQTYSLQFLERFKSVARTEKDDILRYARQFDMVAKVLIQKGVLGKYTAGVWFLHGLPQSLRSKVIRKHDIDTEDPDTIDYDRIFEFVEKASKSDKAI